MNGDGSEITEFSFEEFTRRLGLPPGSSVTSIGMIWFDFNYGSGSNMVRVHYRPGRAAPLKLVTQPLEERLRQLAARWRAQSRHPMRRNKPDEAALIAAHADDLLAEIGVKLPRETPAAEKKGNHADHQD